MMFIITSVNGNWCEGHKLFGALNLIQRDFPAEKFHNSKCVSFSCQAGSEAWSILFFPQWNHVRQEILLKLTNVYPSNGRINKSTICESFLLENVNLFYSLVKTWFIYIVLNQNVWEFWCLAVIFYKFLSYPQTQSSCPKCSWSYICMYSLPWRSQASSQLFSDSTSISVFPKSLPSTKKPPPDMLIIGSSWHL